MGRPKNSKNKTKSKHGGWSNKEDFGAQVRVRSNDITVESDYESCPKDLHEHLISSGRDIEPGMKKRKVAPRSGLQFKVGPSFDHTTLYRPIYVTSTNESVFPFVHARVDRGFERCNDEWIGYKRNYFTLVGCFELEDKTPDIFFHEKFHILNDQGEMENISCFALRLVSKCSEDDMTVNLIQHTAKRDRGPQYLPPVYPAISGYLPSHSIIKQASNIRNNDKIDQYNKLFFLDSSALLKVSEDSVLSTYPEGRIATVARYERIQFSTSINYRKPTMVNRHFILRVELLGLLDDGKYAVLASTETQPLVVRGRSPSNYQIAKRNMKSMASNDQLKMQRMSRTGTAPDTGGTSSDESHKLLIPDYSVARRKYPRSDLYKPSKRSRTKKEKLEINSIMNWNPSDFVDDNPRPDLENLDEVLKDSALSDAVSSKIDPYDPMFEPFPFQSGFDFNLDPTIRLKSPSRSKSKKKAPHSKDQATHEDYPDSASKTLGSNTSNNYDDSFLEFQKELSMLQKELKSDLDGDKSILSLVT